MKVLFDSARRWLAQMMLAIAIRVHDDEIAATFTEFAQRRYPEALPNSDGPDSAATNDANPHE